MTTQLPLAHRRIIVTRSPDQAEALCAPLEAVGATCIRFPVIEFVPLPAPELDEAITHLERYHWLLLTSSNAVRFFWHRLESYLPELPTTDYQSPITDYQFRIAAIGSATQKLLAEKGIRTDFVPAEFSGEQLVWGLGDVAGKRILLPRAKIGRPEIVRLLHERGAVVDDIALYDTVTAVPTPESLTHLEKGADVLTFTSPSSVRNFFKILETRADSFLKPIRSALVACIGPSTAAEAAKFGLSVDIMPDEYTIEGLVTAVTTFVEATRRAPTV